MNESREVGVSAVSGLSVMDQSSVATSDKNTSSHASAAAAAAAAASSGGAAAAVDCASGAAGTAVAKSFPGNKKKPAEKGARKVKASESKSKELVLYDHQTLKCGALLIHNSAEYRRSYSFAASYFHDFGV